MNYPAPETGTVLTIYYDGACHLCSREISHYKRRDREKRIQLIDIAAPGFDASQEGLDPVQVNRVMHVRTSDGQIHSALNAFIQIWKVVPGYLPLAKIADSKWARPFFDLGYHSFAKIRPFLPKRKNHDCDTGACSR